MIPCKLIRSTRFSIFDLRYGQASLIRMPAASTLLMATKATATAASTTAITVTAHSLSCLHCTSAPSKYCIVNDIQYNFHCTVLLALQSSAVGNNNSINNINSGGNSIANSCSGDNSSISSSAARQQQQQQQQQISCSMPVAAILNVNRPSEGPISSNTQSRMPT